MKKACILVVEDERIAAEDIRTSLEKFGYTVPAVLSSGNEALKKTEEIRPDLVLMDIVLKGSMDGIEAAEKIYLRFGIPVVFLSAYTLKRAKKIKPYGYILKPFEENVLQEVVERALLKHQMERN